MYIFVGRSVKNIPSISDRKKWQKTNNLWELNAKPQVSLFEYADEHRKSFAERKFCMSEKLAMN